MNVIVGMIYVCCVLIGGLNGDGGWEYVLACRYLDIYIYIYSEWCIGSGGVLL